MTRVQSVANSFISISKYTAPYSPPQNCSAKALSSTTITLTWLQPESNSINGVLRYYHVAVDDPSGYNVHNHLVDHEMLNTTVDGLHPYYLYNCTVTAVTVDKSPPASVLIKTLEDSKKLDSSLAS